MNVLALSLVISIVSLFLTSTGAHVVVAPPPPSQSPSVRNGGNGQLVLTDANATVTLSALLGRFSHLEALSVSSLSGTISSSISSSSISAGTSGSTSTSSTSTSSTSASSISISSALQQLQSIVSQQASQLALQSQLNMAAAAQLSAQVVQLSADNSRLSQLLSQVVSDECSSSSSTSNNALVLFQSIPTQAAFDLEYFTLNGQSYLAVANYNNGTSYAINSQIFKFDATSNSFLLFQSIPTQGATDWEFFTIDNQSYLAVANSYNGTTRAVNSFIYRFNGAQFVPFQTIATLQAMDWEFFTMGKESYLALANRYNDTSPSVDSKIFRFDNAMSSFVLFQSIPTAGAWHWTFFSIGNQNFLALANQYAQSQIFVFNSSANLFSPFQSIPALAAVDWTFFVMGGQSFLAVSNNGFTPFNSSTTNYSVDSQIFRFDSASSRFVLFQNITTFGANGWKYFSVNNHSYLAVANQFNNTNYNINSVIYRSDGSSAFVPFQTVATNGALDWEFFTLGNGISFLAVANDLDESARPLTNSQIYKVLGVCM